MEVIAMILVAISAFVATNIDDLFVLMLFFAAGKHEKNSIVIGQYLGFLSLVLISSTAYFLQFIVPSYFISLLGIFPVLIGFKKLLDVKNHENMEREGPALKNDSSSGSWRNVFQVAVVTFTNGGDNLGVYAPLFAGMETGQILIVSILFMVMVGIWCILASLMVENRFLGNKIDKYSHIILPFVLIALGFMILAGGIMEFL
ncbi:Cadmium resistance transporter [anaerobic digester metagenome]